MRAARNSEAQLNEVAKACRAKFEELVGAPLQAHLRWLSHGEVTGCWATRNRGALWRPFRADVGHDEGVPLDGDGHVQGLEVVGIGLQGLFANREVLGEFGEGQAAPSAERFSDRGSHAACL